MPNPPLLPLVPLCPWMLQFPSFSSLYSPSLLAELHQTTRTTLHRPDTATSPLPPLAERCESPDDDEESPSLRDIAAMTRLREGADPRPSHGLALPTEPRRPPLPPDSFEFVHIIGSEMCAAEDVFLRGQLLPYRPPPASTRSPARPSPTACSHGREHRRCPSEHERRQGRHRRAESLDGYERRGGTASRYWKAKGSVSADYQRLRPVAEACDARADGRAGVSSPRPKWYVLVFGSVSVPGEMDMRSIKSRLRRRTSSGGDGGRGETVAGTGCGVKPAGGGGWKLLRSLSCKGDVGAVVDAPLSLALT